MKKEDIKKEDLKKEDMTKEDMKEVLKVDLKVDGQGREGSNGLGRSRTATLTCAFEVR